MLDFARYQMIRDQSIRDSTENQPSRRFQDEATEVNFGKNPTKPVFTAKASSIALVEPNLATQAPAAGPSDAEHGFRGKLSTGSTVSRIGYGGFAIHPDDLEVLVSPASDPSDSGQCAVCRSGTVVGKTCGASRNLGAIAID